MAGIVPNNPSAFPPSLEVRCTNAASAGCAGAAYNPFAFPPFLATCSRESALSLGVGFFSRLTPSRMPTETKTGPKGRERDLARPPAAAGCPFEGPAEATEAIRGPVGFTGEGAGGNGFGDFCRNKSHPPYGAGAPLVHRRLRRHRTG